MQSNAPGIFGLAFQGAVAGGITLHVPTPELERARDVLRAQERRHLTLVTDHEDVEGAENAGDDDRLRDLAQEN